LRSIRYEENFRGIKYPLRLYVSLTQSLFLSFCSF